MIVVLGATIMPVLHIQLLGDFGLTYDNTSLTATVFARPQALLAYLVLHRHAPQSRQHLAFLFWPDASEPQALTNLRNLLHKLRQVLPEPDQFLQIDVQTVQWRPDAPFTLDVADFMMLIQSSKRIDLEQATKLYRGDLLPSCYDEWIVPERERLLHMLLDAFEKLILQAETSHEYLTAVGYAKLLLQRDHLSEETYRQLMRLHALNDDRAAAMHVYHTCATTLQRELGVEPSPLTRQAYEQILNLETQKLPLALPATVLPLVGREHEWTLLLGLWRAAKTSHPRLALIKGEAGIGKTRLAEELIDWGTRQGVPVLTARCYPSQGQLAYAPLVEWLRSHPLHGLDERWLTELVRLLPEILVEHPSLPNPSLLTQDWQRLRFFEVLAHALLKDHPLLILHLDDIQWCDRDTLDWLRYLMQGHIETAAKVRLLLISSLRTEESSDNNSLDSFLAGIRRTDQLTEIELGPLNESATFSLASHVMGPELDPSLKHLLFQGSEGHPLFLVEMVRSGLGQLRSPASEHANTMTQFVQTLPSKVRQVIEARLGQLSQSAQELAGLAAAVGRVFNFNVLEHASNENEESLVHGLDELWRRRIIREQGSDSYSFSHDKIREVAYTRMSLARRRLFHHRIAQAMEIVYERVLDSVSGQIATHYELAGRLEHAIPYYERAAEAAQRIYANANAIRDYRRAINLLKGPASFSISIVVRLCEHLGDVLHWIGQYGEARSAFAQATVVIPSSEYIHQARLHRKIGNSWRDEHDYQEALQVYQETKHALEQAQVEESPGWWEEWIQVSLEISLVYYWIGQLQDADQLCLQLEPVIEQHGAPAQRAAYFQSIWRIEFRRNRFVATPEVVSVSKAVLAIEQQISNQAGVPAAQFGIGFTLLWHRDVEPAKDLFQMALRLAEETGDISLQARCLSYLTIAYRQSGQIEETEQSAARNLEVATLANMPEYIAMAKANQAWIAWRVDNIALSQELSNAALKLWHQLPSGHASAPFQWLAYFPLIAVSLQQDKVHLAVNGARALLDPNLQRLPDTLITTLEQAIQAWDRNEAESAHVLLHQLIVLAQQMHYL
jgi:DNA-binding SARP family transcriptional activator/tetratricopeptide (TPR) repeat protein